MDKFRVELRDTDQGSRMKAVFVFRAAAVKALHAVLRPDQAARLGQIEIQAGGMQSLTREDVLTELKLTDRQKESLREVNARFQDEVHKLFADLSEEGQARALEQARALQRKTVGQFIGSLTA